MVYKLEWYKISENNVLDIDLLIRRMTKSWNILNNIVIERENVTKFLGVLIDKNLSWKQHIRDVSTKISKSIHILYKSRGIVKQPLSTLFRMGFFGAARGWVGQKGPLPKICHTYSTMMKLGAVIPYQTRSKK